MTRLLFITFILLFANVNSLIAEEYFTTLRYNNVNLRQGPSKDYPIKIFYKKQYLPVLVQDTSNNYRKVRDHEDNTGWIHVSQLSKKKAALVLTDKVIMFENSTIFSKLLAILEKGRLCLIFRCKNDWCKIKVEKYLGWVEKKSLWGKL